MRAPGSPATTPRARPGWQDRSSRPHTSPRRTRPRSRSGSLATRDEQRRGPDWIGAELGVPARTVSRILPRHGLPRLAELDPMTGEVIRASQGHRGPLRARPARRAGAHGREEDSAASPTAAAGAPTAAPTAPHRRTKASQSGYDYVHSLVDDHSRLAYSEILPDEKGADLRGVPHPRRGLLRRPRHRPDRAGDDRQRLGLRGRCATWSPQLGRPAEFIKPHCPWQNGKVERLNRTLPTEWAYRQVFTSNTERTAALAPWLELLQHSTPPQRTRRTPTDQPPVTNLMAGYT